MDEQGSLRRMAGVITAVLLAAGCSSATTVSPLSADPKPINRDKFEGVWIIDNDPYVVRFGDDGVARIAGVGWAKEEFKLVHGEMIVAEGRDNNFVSVRFQEDGEWPDTYFFVQYKFVENGDLVIWKPIISEFKDAVKEETLQGEVSRRSVVITSPPEKILEFLNDPGRDDLFDYRDPGVLRKVQSPENHGSKEDK